MLVISGFPAVLEKPLLGFFGKRVALRLVGKSARFPTGI
jgi:hypothetical protein